MNIIHITQTPDGGYFIVDAIGEAGADAGFAPTSAASTEEELRAGLKKRGITDKAIEIAIRQVTEGGNAMIQV
jgi:hypothetical protein